MSVWTVEVKDLGAFPSRDPDLPNRTLGQYESSSSRDLLENYSLRKGNSMTLRTMTDLAGSWCRFRDG